MKLFKLTVNWNAIYPNSKSYGHYDSYYDKIIRAETEHAARELANKDMGDEGKIWEDTAKVLCQVITPFGTEEVILTNFLAGWYYRH